MTSFSVHTMNIIHNTLLHPVWGAGRSCMDGVKVGLVWGAGRSWMGCR